MQTGCSPPHSRTPILLLWPYLSLCFFVFVLFFSGWCRRYYRRDRKVWRWGSVRGHDHDEQALNAKLGDNVQFCLFCLFFVALWLLLAYLARPALTSSKRKNTDECVCGIHDRWPSCRSRMRVFYCALHECPRLEDVAGGRGVRILQTRFTIIGYDRADRKQL